MIQVKVTIAKIYEFDGWYFEYHRTKPFLPWPCKKDLEPRKRAGNKFFEMFERFSNLSIEEQENHRVI